MRFSSRRCSPRHTGAPPCNPTAAARRVSAWQGDPNAGRGRTQHCLSSVPASPRCCSCQRAGPGCSRVLPAEHFAADGDPGCKPCEASAGRLHPYCGHCVRQHGRSGCMRGRRGNCRGAAHSRLLPGAAAVRARHPPGTPAGGGVQPPCRDHAHTERSSQPRRGARVCGARLGAQGSQGSTQPAARGLDQAKRRRAAVHSGRSVQQPRAATASTDQQGGGWVRQQVASSSGGAPAAAGPVCSCAAAGRVQASRGIPGCSGCGPLCVWWQ
mmetsp:Transcript_27682/g.70504  ORF Transcript_27682/g.70504 Transcript_27682/m.70504 type:complete len:269 (+) Transcript_27682:100-906(+)